MMVSEATLRINGLARQMRRWKMSDLIKRLRMGTQVPEFELRQEAADEIERLQAALEAVRGFCKYCGATYPHRYGEGRCGHCAALDGEQDQDNE